MTDLKPTEIVGKFGGLEFSLDSQFALGTEVYFNGFGSIEGENYKPLQKDGEVKVVYKVQPIQANLVMYEHGVKMGESLAEFKKKSPSQLQRSKWYLIWEKTYQPKYPDFDSFYGRVMDRISEIQSSILDGELSLSKFLLKESK